MDVQKKMIAERLFKLKIYESDGFEFQHLFEKVMKYKYGTDFNIVKPMGRTGDKKNDGYISSSNTYYQVYGPEDIINSIDYAINKIKIDYAGLMSEWRNAQEIVYVVNDKFKGVGPNEHLKIQELVSELKKISDNSKVKVSLYGAYDLCNDFMELGDISIYDVIGNLDGYNYDDFEEIITYDDFSEIINFILKMPYEEQGDKLFPPDYDEKIKTNNFSQDIKSRLKTAHLNHADLENFFAASNPMLEENVKNRIISLYRNAIVMFDDNSDLIYENLIVEICPEKTRVNVFAAESIISYYFECCDIFKSPEVSNEI